MSPNRDASDSAEENLHRKHIVLPKAPKPVANYVTSVRVGALLYVSGHGPAPSEGVKGRGKVGAELSLDEGYKSARQTGLSILATVKDALGSLDRVARVVKVLGLVNCTPEFADQPKVINGCSDLFVEVFGEERGRAARSAIGTNALPGGIPTEIEAIFEVRA
jgi:enamine deaminase RidA (YjgF/YER057c/UK114 family)